MEVRDDRVRKMGNMTKRVRSLDFSSKRMLFKKERDSFMLPLIVALTLSSVLPLYHIKVIGIEGHIHM